MNIFLKTYEIESVFYIHAPLDFKFLGCLAKEEKNINILLTPVNTLTIFKEFFGSCIIISVTASLSVAGRFSPVSTVHPSLDAEKIRVNVQFLVHILGVFRCDIFVFLVKIATSQLLKRVDGRILRISKS